MSRKVFISVLGAGLYEGCKYTANGFCSKETRFVQQATLEYLNAQEWPEDSKAFFLLTNKARSANWIVESEKRFNKQQNANVSYTGLQKVLESSGLPFQCEGVSIPDGKDEAEMWKIFETAFKLLEDGDELYFDLTHSYRYLPMLMLVLGNYAKFLKQATVCSITYGNYEARDIHKNEAPIVQLLPLSSLQDWTFATADFLKNGYTDRLVELSAKQLDPLMRNAETRTEDTKRLKSFVNNLRSFSLDMQTCRGLRVIEASTIERTRSDINALHNVVIPQLEPVLHEVKRSIEPFCTSDDIANAFKASQWCYNNQQYQQAVTFLEEGFISYFCARYGIALDDRNKRELVTGALNILSQDIPKGKWRVSKPEWKVLLESIVKDELLNSLVKEAALVSALRNDFNHCGMRKGAQQSKDIKEKIKKCIDTIIPQLLFPITLIQISTPPKGVLYLINFSNHPSEYWGQKQLEAAKGYGKIKDIPFPMVDPEASYDDIRELAEQYVEKILAFAENNKITVHVMGEMTFCYLVVTKLKEKGVDCIASTTERISEEITDGRKIIDFHFVKFRSY
jgi:CRISPR-associated Csx2 family protein